MILFLKDFAIFFVAVLLVVGAIFLFGSILFSFFGKKFYKRDDDLPLDMIYKSK